MEAAIDKCRKYNRDVIDSSYITSKSMRIDPAYDSSTLGIVATSWVDGLVHILHAEDYRRPNYDEMLFI